MTDFIRLRSVRVNNLCAIDLDLPKKKLIGLCGPSGSGKSSVAMDTLYAEGQRRYLDTFSLAERGRYQQPEKPDADEIESVPPAIAVTRSNETCSDRTTVGNLTDVSFLLQVALTRFGLIICPNCKTEVRQHSPDSVFDFLSKQVTPSGESTSLLIGFHWDRENSEYQAIDELIANGFQRCLINGSVQRLDQLDDKKKITEIDVLVDRVRLGGKHAQRLRDSIETAFVYGSQSCLVLKELLSLESQDDINNSLVLEIDGKSFSRLEFSSHSECVGCGNSFPRLRPDELSANSPQGACERCLGIGELDSFSPSVIRDALNQKPNDESGGEYELAFLEHVDFSTLLEQIESILNASLVDSHNIVLRTEQLKELVEVLEHFDASQSKKTIRRKLDFLRERAVCESCHGTRINPVAMSHRISGLCLSDLEAMPVSSLMRQLNENSDWETVKKELHVFDELVARLTYLQQVGLEYLTLDRRVNSLSTGERQRVSMTNALGSKLVNMLYLFDEPCSGLHPDDISRLITSIRALKDRGNTVIAVDHELELVSQADFVSEFGPGAGSYGGRVTFSGLPSGLSELEGSVTGDLLSGRKSLWQPRPASTPPKGSLELQEASGNNLKNVSVSVPLGQLVAFTGVSGSGKSSLLIQTLYPAVGNRLSNLRDRVPVLPFQSISGVEQIDDVVLIDQAPETNSPGTNRSNAATYTKAFDFIRNVFAETVDARARNINAGRFSFNTDGGRCDACKGEGTKQIDLKYMANLHVKCKFCQGKRYKKEVLNCRYRGCNISEVLGMTVRDAFAFFRGQKKVQSRLKPIIDVGLEYLLLGQPTSTLSSGETQRLRLAGYLGAGRKTRTLFIMDEPSIGLHYCDVGKLLDCFNSLLAEGHSVMVVEHNRLVMSAADHIIDMGPGAGEFGGQIVASGSPRQLANQAKTGTGKVLAKMAKESN